MSLLAWIVVAALAAYRVTRLLVIDSLFDGARDRVQAWLGKRPTFLRMKALELTLCPYCVGVWVSAAVWLVIAHVEGWWYLPVVEHAALIAAIAAIQATLQSINAALEAYADR